MGDIVYLEHYRSFREAATRAKAVAGKQQTTAHVSRDANRWRVGVAASAGPLCVAMTHADDFEDWDELAQFYADQDDRWECEQEISEEIEMEREDWARSNEDGWFYADNDPD